MGTGEHTHSDEFDGLLRSNALKRRALRETNARVGGRGGSQRRRQGRVRPPSPEPYFRSRVIKANIRCRNAVILHIVDRIFFPDTVNMEVYESVAGGEAEK